MPATATKGGRQTAAPRATDALRRMTCDNCGYIWQAIGRPTEAVHCSMCGEHICACGCGADLGAQRDDAIYSSRACAMALKRAEGATTPAGRSSAAQKANVPRTEHPLDEVRDTQEQWKEHWTEIVYQGIVECLRCGSFHADDLDPLGIPDEHRNIIGSQTGSLVSRRYIHEVDRRASANPSRKSAKSGVYEFTRRGREVLMGAG